MRVTVVLAFAALVAVAAATIGVDLSSAVSVGTFQCLRNNGVNFMIARVYTEVGTCDSGGMASIKNARAAGIPYTDGYIYPDLRQSAAGQIDAMLNCLHANGVNFGMIWLDVEGTWTASKSTNANFIAELSRELDARGVNHGVYTNANGWNSITGGWTGMAHKPLWWAYWDGSASWSHWSSFGGWAKPAMKQYHGTFPEPKPSAISWFVGDTSLCGASIDLNFY